MSTSIGNSKVYLFLARTERNNSQDWQLYADKKYGNSDGVVSQSEFEQFITAEYYDAMGEKLSSRDFNIFWSSVDTDKVDFKNNYGNKVNGAYNLSAKEIEKLDKEMEDFVKLDAVCVLAEANLKGLFNDYDDNKQWMSLVTTKLVLALEEWRAAGRPCGDFYNYMTTNTKGIQQFATIQAEATATVQKDNVIEDWKSNPNSYWDELAELDPPYDLGNDPDIDNAINKLVIQKIRESNITDVSEIKGLLESIKGEIEQVIKDTIAKKGLDEEGKAIPVPDLDENGDPIRDEDGNYQVTDPDDNPITDTQVQSWTAQLIAMLESSEFATTITTKNPEYANYLSIFKDAGKKYITNTLIKDLESSYKDSFTEFEKAVQAMNGATIAAALLNDKTITEEIDAKIAKENARKQINDWLTNGLRSVLFDTNGYSAALVKIINSLEASGIMGEIIQYVNNNFDTFYDKTKNGTGIYALQGSITSYAKEYLTMRVAAYCSDGTQSDTEADAMKLYEDINGLITKNNLTDDKKYEAMANNALGYFKNVANLGYKDEVEDVLNIYIDTLNVEWLKTKEKLTPGTIDNWIKGVHEKIVAKTQEPGGRQEPPGTSGYTSLTEVGDNVIFDNESLTDILNDTNASGIDLTGWGSWTETIKNAKANIATTLKGLGAKLIAAGMDEKRVNWAVTTCINFYQAAFDAIDNVGDTTSSGKGSTNNLIKFNYKDADGKQRVCSDGGFQQYSAKKKDDINITNGAGMLGYDDNMGIRLEEAYDGGDKKANLFIIGINKKALLLQLQNFLNAYPY